LDSENTRVSSFVRKATQVKIEVPINKTIQEVPNQKIRV